MSRTGKQKHEGGRGRKRGTGQGKGGQRRDPGTGSSAGGGGGRGKKRRGNFQWREKGRSQGHGLFVEGGDLGEWRPSGSPLQEPYRHVQWGDDGLRRNGRGSISAVEYSLERELTNFKAVNYSYPSAEDVSTEMTDTSMLERSVQSVLPTDLMRSNPVQGVESSVSKDMLRQGAFCTPQNPPAQKVPPLRLMGSSTKYSSKDRSTRDLELRKPKKQGFAGSKRGAAKTGNRSKAWRSGCSSWAYNAPLSTRCMAESYEDSIGSEALETSDIDEELAEDYVSNLAGEVSLDLLEEEMSARDISLAQTPIDSMIINPQSLDISEDMTYSCASSDEENEDVKCIATFKNIRAAGKKAASRQENVRKLMKTNEDIELGSLAGRILVEEGSGYSSEEEDSPEEDSLLEEEYRLRYLALDDSADESLGNDSNEEDQVERIIKENEGPCMLESKALAKEPRRHKKHSQSKQGPNMSKKLPKTGLPGQKKRQRKEMIAAKRRERALNRGVDFEAINGILQELVEDDGDIFAFEPMTNQDRSLVHKLASAYRLNSASQGSGRKRFVVVTRTQHTCLPSGNNEKRLLKLLGRDGAETENFQDLKISGHGEKHRLAKKYRRAAHQARQSLKQSQSEGALSRVAGLRKSELVMKGSFRSKKSSAAGVGRLSSSPVCFVSCGMVGPDDRLEFRGLQNVGPTETFVDMESPGLGDGLCEKQTQSFAKASSNEFGQFEAHTKAFGSRLMAKMGFVEGHGLGRDGQGITQPVIAIQRPKTLGLGA